VVALSPYTLAVSCAFAIKDLDRHYTHTFILAYTWLARRYNDVGNDEKGQQTCKRTGILQLFVARGPASEGGRNQLQRPPILR
jgi:hypothetical protein